MQTQDPISLTSTVQYWKTMPLIKLSQQSQEYPKLLVFITPLAKFRLRHGKTIF